MSNRTVQETHAGSNRIVRAENCDDGSQQMSSSGSHDEYRSGARGNIRGETTTGYHGENTSSAYGSSGSSSTSRHRGGSEGYSSGQTGYGGRHGGSSTGYSGGSTVGPSGSTGGYRSSSGASGYGSASSGHKVSISSSSSNVSRSGNVSGGFSNRSTGGFSSRSSGGRQGFGSGLGGASGNVGLGGFSGGSLSGGQRGGIVTCSSGCFSNGGDGLLQLGEKETMQNLNSRLSAYMDKVRALEDSNAEIENLIRNWYETHKPKKVDTSKYYATIEDLNTQILAATMDHNELSVEADNARLAADDFKTKYESELSMHQNVERDIEGLRKVLDDLTLEKASLESQVETLTEEIAFNKKTHDEEMKTLQGQTSDVNVQVDAAPGINMLRVLSDMRAQYEEMAEANRRKTEADYNQKLTELSNEISFSNAENETGKSEVTELRRTMQTMEIDLQSQLAMKSSLEVTLAETQARYASQLAQIQDVILHLEEQLGQVRTDMENQSCEYKLLLDIKTRLENEIEMYRRLLDGEGGSSGGSRGGSRGGYSGGSSGSYSGGSSGGYTGGSSGGYTGGSSGGPNSGSSGGFNAGSSSGFTSGSSSGFTGGSNGGYSHGSGSGSGGMTTSGSVSGSSSTEWSSTRDGRTDSSSVTDPKKNRLVTTITEERVDGRLVSTKVDKVAQKI